MGSQRLPGKVMMPLAGKPMLWHIAERVVRAESVDGFYIATPIGDNIAQKMGYCDIKIVEPLVSEDDLIGRFYSVAKMSEADIIVRICADNPFVEPAEIDRAVQFYLEKPRIFVSNMHQHPASCMIYFNDREDFGIDVVNGYPDGIGCEVFSMSTLTWMQEHLKKPNMREHPHLYFHEQGLVESPKCPQEFARPDLKLDVNTEDDFKFVKDIYDNLYPKNNNFHITDVIEYLDKKK